ncbi:MAG: hypothetical protein ACXWEX_05035 [Thermoanaerobaculia bacterium]
MTDAIHEGVTVEALQALLSEQSAFTRAFEFQVRALEPGLCHLLVPFNPLSERPGGILSGQVYMTAADVAMWLAIKTLKGLHDNLRHGQHDDLVRAQRAPRARRVYGARAEARGAHQPRVGRVLLGGRRSPHPPLAHVHAARAPRPGRLRLTALAYTARDCRHADFAPRLPQP